jgi:predicted acylesterase/phospholipase RssA
MEILSSDRKVKTNIAFSGGGARGAWQWEMFSLIEHYYEVESVCGSSTGTLTALCAAKRVPKYYMDKLYNEAFANNARSIFRPGIGQIKNGKFKINDWKFFPKLIFNRNKIKGAMSIEPLVDLVASIHKQFPDFYYNFLFNVVDLYDGRVWQLSYADFDDDHQFARAVAASCAIPGLVEPIRNILTKKGTIICGVDGGTREGFPAKQAFDAMHPGRTYQVILLGCNTPEITPTDDLGSIFGILGATGTAVLNEMMLDDVAKVELVNVIVEQVGEQATGKRFATIFKVYYKDGRGVLEFTPEALASMRESGRSDFERFKVVNKLAA